MYKRRPLNHLNNWHSYARLFARTSGMCILSDAHNNNSDSAEDAKHLHPRFIRVHAVRTGTGWHGRNAPEEKCSRFPNVLYIHDLLFCHQPRTKVQQFSLHLASSGEYLSWMNKRHVELQHNDKCILRKFERGTCMAIYGTLNKQRCLSF